MNEQERKLISSPLFSVQQDDFSVLGRRSETLVRVESPSPRVMRFQSAPLIAILVFYLTRNAELRKTSQVFQYAAS